jgi:hypothetical protein
MSTELTEVEEAKKLTPWELYEQRKAQLPADLTPEEYQAACKRIVAELGI